MSNKSTWRLGFVGFIYTPPADITDPVEGLKWHMSKTHELGGGVTQFGPAIKWDQKSLEAVREHMAVTDNELELGAPVFGGFQRPGDLIRENVAETRETLDRQIQAAKFLGVRILRGAYGKLKLKYTRYNKDYPRAEHMRYVIDNLTEAARIMEDNDLYLAIENHCDFTGREFHEIFSAVGSKHVGCTLDSANGFTVYSDPNEDNEWLAPWAFTTHVKDMLVQDFESPYGLIPFQARGCAVGDGNVDIPRLLDLLDDKSPMSRGLHVVIEQGWMNYDNIPEGPARAAYDKECVRKGLAYLKGLLGRA